MTDINTRVSDVGTNEDGTLRAVIDGVLWSTIQHIGPNFALVKEWEAAGNTIPPYVAPEQPTIMPKLTPRQLELGLLSIGLTSADIEAEINTIENASDRDAALIEWRRAGSFERDHPVLVDVAAALNLPSEQVDALWIWAAGL